MQQRPLPVDKGCYPEIIRILNEECTEIERALELRRMCLEDLFFLLVYAMGRVDANHDWLFARCREVQAEPDNMLDLWSREFYKSTIITFALTIQNILNNPDITIGIFSHTRPIAKSFLRQIKREFELNDNLKRWFPDILYDNPSKQAIKWSEDDGIIVKRSSNPKEGTVEAYGVVDGQPTAKHYSLLVYDDIVTRESVNTPDMIEKTTDALALSFNLGAQGGKRRFIGTRYHFADTYKTIMDRGTATSRIYAATDDGTMLGNPVFLTQEQLDTKRRDMGPFVYACFTGETKIIMSSGKQKTISNIVIGEEVFGYTFPDKKNARVGVVRSKVVAIQTKKKAVSRFTFASGRDIICTPDHKFYTGRRGAELGGKDSHKTYLPIEKIKQAISLYDPRNINKAYDKLSAAWLAGLFDGEGSVSANTIYPTRFLGKMGKDKVVKIENLGEKTVYNIQTETGNYIAEGYAVKNCQMLQNPVADGSQGFNRNWLNRYSGEKIQSANWYLLVDAANGKRKNNDYTSIWAVGLGMDGNYYAIPEVRDRLNLTERTNKVIELHRKYRPVEVRYEKYGMMADVEYILAAQDRINYRFQIIEVGGAMPKIDRIKRLIPLFETGKIFIPHIYTVTDYEGKARDNVHAFVEEEYSAFPVSLHDDMLDAMARICETKGRKNGHDGSIDLVLQWPDKQKPRRQSNRSSHTPQDAIIGY